MADLKLSPSAGWWRRGGGSMTGASKGVTVFNALLTATCDTRTPSVASRSVRVGLQFPLIVFLPR